LVYLLFPVTKTDAIINNQHVKKSKYDRHTVYKRLSLHEAILLALRYNPDVKNAEIQRVADKFALKLAKNNFEFQYALTASLAQTDNQIAAQQNSSLTTTLTPTVHRTGVLGTTYSMSLNNPIINGIYHPGIDLKLTQPLMRGFGKKVATASLYSATQSEKINQLNLRSALIQAVVAVITAYRQFVIDQNNIVIDKLSLKDYAQTIKLNNALIKAGRQAPTEVIQTKAEYTQMQFTLKNDKNIVKQDRLNLLRVIGLPAQTKIIVPKNIKINKRQQADINKILAISLKNNITYLSQAIQLTLDKRQFLVDKDAARTQLNLTLEAEKYGVVDTNSTVEYEHKIYNDEKHFSALVNLNIPIDNYTLKQAIINDKVILNQDAIKLATLARNLKLTLIADTDTIETSYDAIKIAKTTLKLQRENQKYLQAKLKYGLVSTFEVTTKQQQLDQARVQLLQQKIAYLNAQTQLYSDMGTILNQWHIKVRY